MLANRAIDAYRAHVAERRSTADREARVG
jgi:hypothetical protein